MPRFEIVTPPVTVLGENPLWDIAEEKLYWLDVFGGTVFRSRADGSELEVQKVPGMPACLALRAGGGLVLALGTGIYLFDFESGELDLVSDPRPDETHRINDGKVDRQGRFVIGTIDTRLVSHDTAWLREIARPDAGLFRLDPDLSVTSIAGDFGISNGPCFNPSGDILYCADSWAEHIVAFDYDIGAGTVSDRRIIASYDGDKGRTGSGQPDGATVDSEGYIWSTCVYGGELRRYAPNGSLDRKVPVPIDKPTSVGFGGPDLDVLYMTTMNNPALPIDLPPDPPIAGSIFAIHGLGVTGLPETRFAG